jgi:hypothetical protein
MVGQLTFAVNCIENLKNGPLCGGPDTSLHSGNLIAGSRTLSLDAHSDGASEQRFKGGMVDRQARAT